MDAGGNQQAGAVQNMTNASIDQGANGGQDTAGVNHHPNGGEQQPTPPPAQPSIEQVTITFRDMNGFQLAFRVKPTTALGKAMDAFAAKAGRPTDHFRFLVDGTRVRKQDTIVDLEMEDGDIVEVHTEQIGGGGGEERLYAPAEPIIVIFQDVLSGEKVTFKIRPTTPLGKAMDYVAKKAGKPDWYFRYMVNGTRVHAHHTVVDFNMRNEDVVLVLPLQTG